MESCVDVGSSGIVSVDGGDEPLKVVSGSRSRGSGEMASTNVELCNSAVLCGFVDVVTS